jgi:hypothetical protein
MHKRILIFVLLLLNFCLILSLNATENELVSSDSSDDIITIKKQKPSLPSISEEDKRGWQELFGEIKQIHYEKEKKIIKKDFLVKNNKKNRKLNTHYHSYGGAKGNKIFKTISNKISIPIIIDFLKAAQQRHSQTPLTEAESCALFDVLLDMAGQERQYIAQKAFPSSQNTPKFGRRLQTMVSQKSGQERYLEDPINENSFPQWHHFLINIRLKDIIKEAFFRCEKPESNTEITLQDLFNYGRFQLDNKTTLLVSHFMNVIFGRDSAAIQFNFSQETDFNRPVTLDYIDKLMFINIKCIHLDTQKTIELALYRDFINALLWNKTEDSIDILKEHLGRFLFKISASSIYERGQAAITEWILRSLCYIHKFDLIWPEDWMPPTYANYDQQALSVFNINKFVDIFKEKIVLKKLDKK